MLGWLLFGALFTAAVITICVSYLNEDVLRKKLREKNISAAQIKGIFKSDNVSHMKLEALDNEGNEREVEINADDYDRTEIYKGTVIFV